VHRPFHRERVGDGRKVGSERIVGRVDLELDALEKQLRRGVGVLVGFDDVAAGVGDERADRARRCRAGSGHWSKSTARITIHRRRCPSEQVEIGVEIAP
jgi:hypothetical protein